MKALGKAGAEATLRAANTLVLAALLPLAACAPLPEQKPVALTQTNEQGCTRQRSVGPQDAFADPAPVKQACVGPYLLALPQNYFDNQTGTEHDGSFALALEYPSLQPFKPGELKQFNVDVFARTVSINYGFIDRIDVQQALRNAYTPMDFEQDDPARSLHLRKQGEIIHGLSPYYADIDRIRAYRRKQGMDETAPGMQVRWHRDWYVARDDHDEIQTIIKCTAQGVTETGVAYRDGRLVRSRESELPECDHFFIVADHSTRIRVTYVRAALKDWRAIEKRARDLLVGSIARK
ncbi:hypothetical protein [Stenotrophomonas sp.]|uniref:hypothetical protein n=1 Tax=Stenotrophomonas sp. TaxID=69392 RepID=UPI002FC69816